MRFLFIMFFGLCGCTRTADNKRTNPIDSSGTEKADTTQTADLDYDSYFILENYFPSGKVDISRLQTINSDCAILVYPTDEQIEEMKKKEGEENFYTGADDSNWYQGKAIHLIDSIGIKKTAANKQFLQFVGEEKTWTLDIRKTQMPAWNLVLFKKSKAPLIISTVGLTIEQLKDYFETKR